MDASPLTQPQLGAGLFPLIWNTDRGSLDCINFSSRTTTSPTCIHLLVTSADPCRYDWLCTEERHEVFISRVARTLNEFLLWPSLLLRHPQFWEWPGTEQNATLFWLTSVHDELLHRHKAKRKMRQFPTAATEENVSESMKESVMVEVETSSSEVPEAGDDPFWPGHPSGEKQMHWKIILLSQLHVRTPSNALFWSWRRYCNTSELRQNGIWSQMLPLKPVWWSWKY